MQFGKVVISFFLLLTYSFGFAHTLIPHQEKNDEYGQHIALQENKHRHQHHGHQQNEDVGTDHVHIQHDNHFDESLIDLIACFLCELDNPSNDCEVQHYIPEKTREDGNRNYSKAKLIAVFLAVFVSVKQIEPIAEYDKKSNVNYLIPPLENAPHRGPPVLT